MSAPDTNIKRQEKQHRASLLGIGAAVAVGLLMLFAIIGSAFDDAPTEAGPLTVNEAISD